MKFKKGESVHVLSKREQFVFTVTANNTYRNSPAMNWILFFREYPNETIIYPKGMKESFIYNGFEPDNLEYFYDYEIKYKLITLIFTSLNPNKEVKVR